MRTFARIAYLTLIFLNAACWAQSRPAQEPPARFSKFDWALIGGDAVVRGMDAYTTLHAQGVELGLPHWIADHPARMWTYSEGVVAVNALGVRYLERHHHRVLAKFIPIADMAYDYGCVAANFRVGLR